MLMLCIALPVSADTLTDVKTALGKLNAKSPLRATWSLEQSDSTNGKYGNDKSAKRISVEASQDADSFRVEIPRAVMRAETRRTLPSLSPTGIADDIDFADAFSAMLNLGTLAEERRVMWNGAPARLLVLKMKEPKHEHEISIGKVDYKENRMSVWIGADDLPLAAEHVSKVSAGFLMFHGDSTMKKTWQFARKDDHFVVTRYEDWSSFSGLGQQGQGHTIVTVAIH